MAKTTPKKGDFSKADAEALLEYFSTAELNALLERANSKPHERDTFTLSPDGVYIPDGTKKTLETPGGPAGHLFVPLPSQFDTWAENDFYVPDRLDPASLTPTATIGPIVLMPFQKVLFRYIFDPNRPYDDFYQDIIISCLKKTGKSAITSALGRWIAETWGNYSEVVTLGADREHAEDKLFAPISKSIELSPGYESRLQTSFAMMVHPEDPDPEHPTMFVPDYQRPLWRLRSDGAQYIPNHGSIKTAPMDPKGAAGGNQTAALFTEMWVFDSKKARQVHAEFTPPPTRPRSVRIMEGYAGYEGQSGLWEELWELAMNPKLGARMVTREELIPYGGWPYPPAPHAFKDNPYIEHREALDPIPLYVNDNYRIIAYLDQGEVARRMPWQTPAYYKGQIGDESFDRHHRNIPSAHTEEFISKHMWDACSIRNHPGYTQRRDPRTNKPLPPVPERLRVIPPLEEDETIVLSFDGSVDDDTTSLMALSYATWWEYTDPIPAGYTGDGSNLKRKRKVDDSQIMVRAYHVWEPSKARPMNFTTMVKPVLLSYYGFSIDPQWLATHDLEEIDSYQDIEDYDREDYNQGDLDTDNTEGIPYVEGLVPAYNVLEVVYDYYQANDFFLNLRNDFGIWVKAFSQSTGRDKADRDLYVALRDRKIWHDGSPKLDEHRAGAAKRVPKNKDSSTANRIHIVKKSQRSKIDLMITMSQGSFELTRLSN